MFLDAGVRAVVLVAVSRWQELLAAMLEYQPEPGKGSLHFDIQSTI